MEPRILIAQKNNCRGYIEITKFSFTMDDVAKSLASATVKFGKGETVTLENSRDLGGLDALFSNKVGGVCEPYWYEMTDIGPEEAFKKVLAGKKVIVHNEEGCHVMALDEGVESRKDLIIKLNKAFAMEDEGEAAEDGW